MRKIVVATTIVVFVSVAAEAKYDGRGHGETDYQYAWQSLQQAKTTLKEKYRTVLDMLSKKNQKKVRKEQVKWQRTIKSRCASKSSHIVRRLERQIEINRCEADARIARVKALDQFLEATLGEANSRRIAESPSYARIFPAVTEKPQTPILLPDQHALNRVFSSNVSVALESSSKVHYSLKFEEVPGCQKSECLAGAFHVYRKHPPSSVLGPQYAKDETYTIKLAQGVQATLEKENGGGANGRFFRWLRWQQGGTHYALTVKNATESEYKTLANSAIRIGSWR